MLIVTDEQRLRAGIGSLSKRCQYCSKALAAYPLILSDEARLVVYHAACAAELATDILVDLYTFLSLLLPTTSSLCSRQVAQLPLLGQNTRLARAGDGCMQRASAHLERSRTCNQPTSARSRRLSWSKPFSAAPE